MILYLHKMFVVMLSQQPVMEPHYGKQNKHVSPAHFLHAAWYLLKLQEAGRKQEKGTVR